MDVYSVRNKDKNAPLMYDDLPSKVRIQISRLWARITSDLSEDSEEEFWRFINNTLCDKHGLNDLVTGKFFRMTNQEECKVYFENVTNLNESFDVIEIVMSALGNGYANGLFGGRRSDFNGVVSAFNKIFRDNDIGYEYVEGIIIRNDNKILHKEVIDRTIDLTGNEIFINANEEFLGALQHLKARRNKETLNDALKAFESTMKIICDQFEWRYSEGATVRKLIEICIENELIPKYLATHFTGIRTTLESGIGTIRNKVGAHGQGSNTIVVPDSLAIYAAYLTGTCINYLVERL